MSEPHTEASWVGFDGSLTLKFLGSQVTSDAGWLPHRNLDDAPG